MIFAEAASNAALWPLAVYLGLVLLTVGAMIGLSYVLGERHHDRATGEPYESGNVPTGSARLRFPVKYYLVAVFFVIFDLEAAFLFAWAVSIRETGWLGYCEALVFIGVLLVGLVYLWRQGALDWTPTRDRPRPASRDRAADRSQPLAPPRPPAPSKAIEGGDGHDAAANHTTANHASAPLTSTPPQSVALFGDRLRLPTQRWPGD
jgi:NADH-quinone oxidoreductase subunit A